MHASICVLVSQYDYSSTSTRCIAHMPGGTEPGHAQCAHYHAHNPTWSRVMVYGIKVFILQNNALINHNP